MNDYFVDITQTIAVKQHQPNQTNNQLEEYNSIIRTKSNLYNLSQKFNFRIVDETEVKQEIINLNSKKATCHSAVSAKILKILTSQNHQPMYY